MPVSILPVNAASLTRAANFLRAGGMLAFPTETYYGLAVDPFNSEALQRLFRLKARPENKPVLVLLQEREQLSLLAAAIPEPYEKLMQDFWPGPLTLIFPAQPTLPRKLTAESGSVGIRISPCRAANELIRLFGGPLTATSCNRSGLPPATTAQEAAHFFSDNAEDGLVLNGGPTPGAPGSTIISWREGKLCCLRAGRISPLAVRAALPEAQLAAFESGRE